MTAVTLAKLCDNSRRAEGVYDACPPGEGSNTGTTGAIKGCNQGAAIMPKVRSASPSMGAIRDIQDPGSITTQMAEGGAVAISVLTRPYLFGGSPEYPDRVREMADIPVLMNDIAVDAPQVDAAHRLGADCILLIWAVFDGGHASNMRQLVDTAHDCGMQVLVEVHDADELQAALTTECDILGVNNRNLDPLEVSLDTTTHVLERSSDRRPAISESGMCSPSDIAYLGECGASVFLVGTGIMRQGNVKGSVRSLVDA